MTDIGYQNHIYLTDPVKPSLLARMLPSISFYLPFMRIVCRASAQCQKATYADADWCASSLGIFRLLEGVGARIEITGIEHLEQVGGPCVIIGNHMSLLETVILPVIIQSVRNVTFVVKQDLLEYPVFKHVMRSRNPVAVSRTNPREDFKAVMAGGKERLKNGISVIVFPQTTRTVTFEPEQFNTIGVKLAQKAKVPVIPLALKTDAWGNGKYIKDFGPVDSSKPVHLAFGEPMRVHGRGVEEHEAITHFVEGKLAEWRDGGD